MGKFKIVDRCYHQEFGYGTVMSNQYRDNFYNIAVTVYFPEFYFQPGRTNTAYIPCKQLILLPPPINTFNPGYRDLLACLTIPPTLTPIYDPRQENKIIQWDADWMGKESMEAIVHSVSGEMIVLTLLKAIEFQGGG